MRIMGADDHPDPEPPRWKQTPWWHGQARRDYLLAGFMVMMLMTSLVIFVLIVWVM